jgi:hypothetical protein
MRVFFIFLTYVLITGNTFSQTTEDSVKATINTLFAAMKNADGILLKTVFADNAILQTVSRDKEGRTIVRSEDVSEFAASVSNIKKDSADERIVFETIQKDGPLAMAWTPYRFYYNGQFSHCGVNSFQLVRLAGEWKIQYLIDTRRRTGCDPE